LKDDSRRRRVPTWRIMGAIVILVAGVGPLVYGIIYSYLTKTDVQKDIASAALYTWPYLGFVVPFILVLGIWDLTHRYSRKEIS